MRTMPSLDYMGYAISVDALPAAQNRYYSVFAVHRHVANSLAVQAPAACQQGIEDGVISIPLNWHIRMDAIVLATGLTRTLPERGTRRHQHPFRQSTIW